MEIKRGKEKKIKVLNDGLINEDVKPIWTVHTHVYLFGGYHHK